MPFNLGSLTGCWVDPCSSVCFHKYFDVSIFSALAVACHNSCTEHLLACSSLVNGPEQAHPRVETRGLSPFLKFKAGIGNPANVSPPCASPSCLTTPLECAESQGEEFVWHNHKFNSRQTQLLGKQELRIEQQSFTTNCSSL